MNEELNLTPELTLTPDTAAAVQAPAAPELTLEPSAPDTAAQAAAQAARDANAVKLDESMLSDAEKKMVADFAQKIDITDSNMVMQYGAAAQKNIATFSENALSSVKTKDLGEVGDALSSLVVELKNFGQPEKKGIAGLFQKKKNELEAMKASYSKAEVNVEKIGDALQQHQVRLLKDSAMLDKMYEQNLAYFKELSMYILAGKKKLQEAREGKLRELEATAQATGLAEDAQAAKDLADKCNRFEKKIYDLELTRTISIQTAPQIRMIQNNDNVMVEKIQTTLMNTIPLWKNQMVLALGIAHSNEAAQAQRQVNDITNALLKQSAEKLHMASVETAKEAERGIVDIETLKKTNAELIQTLDDVMKIQSEGREKRIAAEAEMAKMENDLKGKLLEIRGGV